MSEVPTVAVKEVNRPTTWKEAFKTTIEKGWDQIKKLIDHHDGRGALTEIAQEVKVAEVPQEKAVEVAPPQPKVEVAVPKSHEVEPKEELFLPSIEDFPPKLQPGLRQGLERLKGDCDKLRQEMASYSDQLIEQERKAKVIEMQQIIDKNYCPFLLGELTTEQRPANLDNYYSKEYLEKVIEMNKELELFCQGKTDFFQTVQIPSQWIEMEPLRPHLNFNLIIDNAQRASKENQRFVSSQEVLCHTTGDTESTLKVLERGVLASKQYQLDHYGEYFFNTVNYPTVFGQIGGVRITNEGKFYTKDFSTDRYEYESPRRRSGKHPYAEFFDIDFTAGEQLWGFEGRGVNFVFRRRQLVSKNECGNPAGEGIAIYDYVRGANVDLTKEPFLIIVDEKRAEAILSLIREKMPNFQEWKDKIPDVDQWIDKHVLVKPVNLAGEELRQVVIGKLYASFEVPNKAGYFVPVDFSSDQRIYHTPGEKYPYQDEFEHPFSGINKEKLQQALSAEGFDPQHPRKIPLAVMAELRKDAFWSYQQNKPSGLSEGYSLQEHTLMVAAQFEKYFADKPLPAGIDRSLFRLIIQGHDSGKGDAVIAKRAAAQHEYTVPIMEKLLRELGYDEKEVSLAKGLLDGDPIGSYLKKTMSEQDTAKEVKRMAEVAKMDQRQFFDLLLILYQVDAGSYTEDAGGFRSLDRLFIFDSQNRKMAFSLETQLKIDALRRAVNG
ncbi:MAG: hypothetical protein M1514_01055 [Patescibacteria group bacterium]|nr:hypothetical protein [Patescibacteria group bacterium]